MATEKFHSAIRWGKPVEELQKILDEDSAVVNGHDEKNGNQAIHLASQNGHLEILKWLVSKGAEVNGQNGKGQTALHMSIAYDFDDQTIYLVEEAKVDKTIKNGDGNEAITGIDGDKVEGNAYKQGMMQFRMIKDAGSMTAAFEAIKSNPKGLVKSEVAMKGMEFAKTFKTVDKGGFWDKKAFMEAISGIE